MRFARRALCICLLLALAPLATAWAAQPLRVAVAANSAEPLEAIAEVFEAQTGQPVSLVLGSTGKLYAQIVNGAPFDLFLAADQERPRRLEAEGRIVPASRFTYAVGALVLWSADPDLIGSDGVAILRAGDFRRLAIANPDLAPYGLAAQQAMESLGVASALRPKLVMGENIGQAYAMVASGNAELGFIAASYIASPRHDGQGSAWPVPPELHEPVRQDAVLLKRAEHNAGARAFWRFLRSETAQAIFRRYGYLQPPAS